MQMTSAVSVVSGGQDEKVGKHMKQQAIGWWGETGCLQSGAGGGTCTCKRRRKEVIQVISDNELFNKGMKKEREAETDKETGKRMQKKGMTGAI